MSKEFVKYELPKNWIWTTIGELGIVASGGTPSTRERRYWDGDIPWITPADLTNYKDKYISSGRRFITQDGLEQSSAKLLPSGTILFSSRAPIGYVAIAKNEIATNQGFKNLILTKWTNPDYIFYYLLSATQLANNMASGTTFLELSASKFSQIPIPLPPRNEQNQIVEKLEEFLSDIDNGLSNLRQVQGQLKIYRQTILKHAFEGKLTEHWRNSNDLQPINKLFSFIQEERQEQYEKEFNDWKTQVIKWEEEGKYGKKPLRIRKPKSFNPINPRNINEYPTLPKNWKWTRIGEVVYKVGDVDHRMPKDHPNGIPYLSTSNIQANGELDFTNTKSISESDYLSLSRKIKPERNDIIFPRYGTIGRNALVNTDKQFLISYSCAIIKAIPKYINPKYLFFYSLSPIIQKEIEKYIVQTTQANIGISSIENFVFPLCSIQEQELIVQELESQFSIIDNLEKAVDLGIQKSEVLQQSVLKRAFGGKLFKPELNNKSVFEEFQEIKKEKEKYFEQQKTQKTDKSKKVKKMDKSLSIEDILKTSSTPISAKEIWERSKHKDDIEAFYAELKKLQGKVKEVEKGMLTLTNES